MFKQLFNRVTGNKKRVDYLLTLILRKDVIKAAVYQELQGKATLVGSAKESLTTPLDRLSPEELLEKCDMVISKAEGSLPENVQTSKTIFGIPEHWQEQGKIAKSYLEKLKRLKIDLELTPIGFLVVTDAISYFLSREEGAPINAIIVELGKHTITVSLLRATRIAESASAPTDENSNALQIEKILKGFTRFEVLPSRIILFDGEKNLEEVEQECIAFPWTKGLPFLHVPRIEILPKDIDERAVVSGIATELGIEVDVKARKRMIHSSNSGFTPNVHPEGQAKEEAQEEETHKEDVLENDNLAFGFAKDGVPKAEIKQEEEVDLKTKLISFLPPLPSFHFLSKLPIPSVSLPKIPQFARLRGRKNIVLPLGVLGLLIFLFILSYLFLLRAQVTVLVAGKTVENEKQVILDPKLTTTSENKIKGEAISITKEGSKTVQVTGKKEIGEKAKGEVTIYNVSDERRTFSKGAVLTSSNSLKFSLDSAVTIASASGDAITGKTPSKENIAVTAVDIGEESNLASGTTFTIAGASSDFAAKNDKAFSGGTKREVTVVTKKDQDSLLEQLLNELKEQATGEFSKETDVRVVDIISQKTIERKFDKNIDEEAQSLSLSAKAEFQALGYKETDLNSLFERTFQNEAGSDFQLSPNGLEASVVSFRKNKDGSLELTTKGKATFVPKVDTEKVKKEIAGKSKKEAEAYIKNTPNVLDILFNIFPPLPFFNSRMPVSDGNITIRVNTQ